MAILRTTRRALVTLALMVAATALPASASPSASRVRDLTIHSGDVPRRLLGYGLVVGLNGTGDRSFGGYSSRNATVHSVVNLLRRFGVEVPTPYLRLRNVAAVLVTAEASPYLRAGGRFEVQVSALGDAISIEGGVLWITPLVTEPDEPPVATAQGPVLVTAQDNRRGLYFALSNSGRIPDGGILEVDPLPVPDQGSRLLLRRPDRVAAARIAAAINTGAGAGTATVEDPGAIRLTLPGDPGAALAAIDTVLVELEGPARIVIHGADGTVVAGGDMRVGSATVHHSGITLQVGGESTDTAVGASGYLQVPPQSFVQDVAAGLHAIGASAPEVAAIFEALRDAGAISAEVVVR